MSSDATLLLYDGDMTITIPTEEHLALIEANVVEIAMDKGWLDPVTGQARTRTAVESTVRSVFNGLRLGQGLDIELIPRPAIASTAAPAVDLS